MPKFYTMFNRAPRTSKNFEEKYEQTYKIKRDEKNGTRKLVPDEKINIYEKIQEGAEELKIKNMIARYDPKTMERLKVDEKNIIDLTNVPENLIDSMNIIANAKSIFERQSKEIRKEFNNDYRQFIAASENGKLTEVLEKHLPKQQAINQGTVQQAVNPGTVQQTVNPGTNIIPGQTQMNISGGVQL